jgi:hypothetical protein
VKDQTEAAASEMFVSRFRITTMPSSLEELVDQSQKVFAHAWMVRTFIKHSDEVEDFPELMGIARTVFDSAMALESRVNDPPGYFRMLEKKLGKLRRAAEQFRTEAPVASAHTNFKQAVISIDACVEEWERLLKAAKRDSEIAEPGIREE